ncbi:hypothetical protein QL285_081319 [Trifolium repens]|nr:hypothetical protein QL285_081319 [Trifolium repens]
MHLSKNKERTVLHLVSMMIIEESFMHNRLGLQSQLIPAKGEAYAILISFQLAVTLEFHQVIFESGNNSDRCNSQQPHNYFRARKYIE